MPRGGKREGAGRPAGGHNRTFGAHKTTLEELARQHTKTALDVLVEIARSGVSEAARVSAATALLDRGYGRPRQAIEPAPPRPAETPVDAPTDARRSWAEEMAASYLAPRPEVAPPAPRPKANGNGNGTTH